METKTYKREGLRLGRIGYFSEKHNGVALDKSNAYALLYKDEENEEYSSIFNDSKYPIFERIPYYANYTKDGEPYGSKIICVGGTEKTGPCYVIETEPLFVSFLPFTVTLEQLKLLMFRSETFFPDRMALLELEPDKRWVRRLKKHDRLQLERLEDYFNSQEVAIQYIKR